MSGLSESTDRIRRRISGGFLLREAAGSLGDLGTFIPLTVGMVQFANMDAASILVFAGVMNIVTGVVFRIPIAVQPMKAVAALAIAGVMSAGQVGMAGFAVGCIVLFLAATGLIGRLARAVPDPVVRGLQTVVAFQLARGAARIALAGDGTEAIRSLWGIDGLIAMGAIIAATIILRRRIAWVALGLVVLGLVGAGLKVAATSSTLGFTLWHPRWAFSQLEALRGVWIGGLPQLPMTLLNSVLAVAAVAAHLYPEKRETVTSTKMAVSVGLMNLVACPLGGMPMCHGSGGLAAQHRFGARSGVSMVMLGAVKLVIGLVFGTGALAWLVAFPSSVLSVFLFMAAASLAGAGRCWSARDSLVTACIMVAVLLAVAPFSQGALPAGFAAGWLAYELLRRGRPKQRRGESKPAEFSHDVREEEGPRSCA